MSDRRPFTVAAVATRWCTVFLALFCVTLLSCTESGSPERLQAPALQPAASKFERIPADKLDPALKRFTSTDRQTAWWKQPEFKKAFNAALAGHRVEPWVRDFKFVVTPGIAFSTPDGIAFLYMGNKPHAGNKALRIVFVPTVGALGIKREDYDRRGDKDYSPKYYGDTRPSIRALLDAENPLS